MDSTEILDKLIKLHNDLSWMLTRAQLESERIMSEARNAFPPLPVDISGIDCAAWYTEAPVKTLKIFIPEMPKVLKTCAAPQWARELGYGKLRDYWWSLVQKALDTLDGPWPHFQTAAVSFSFWFSDHRQRDPDRFAAMYIIDALTWTKILSDDSSDNVIVLFRVGRSDKPGTEITVSDQYEKLMQFIP